MLTTAAILILTFLSILLCRKIISKKEVSLSTFEISLALCCKIALGIIYGYVFLTYYNGDDTWELNASAMDEHKKLLADPLSFFTDFNPVPAFKRNPTVGSGLYYYIVDLEFWLITKPLALFNFISRGNYYINIVFFNFIVFWGHYWLFSLLQKLFPYKRLLLFAAVFLFPPVVFWLSGIRADGLLFFFFSLCLLHFHRWLEQRNKKSLLLVIISLLCILILRNVLLLLLLPALTAWGLCVRYYWRPVRTFLTTWAVGGLLFFASAWVSPSANLPQLVANRQQEFFLLQGNTRLPLDTLSGSMGSYARVLPQAVQNTFFRPWLWEAKGFLQIISSLDSLFFWFLVIIMLIKRDPNWRENIRNPIILALLFFSTSLYLFIGFTIPFPGAIVRYKIVPELFLLTTVILNINRSYDNRITKKVHI